MTPKPSASVSNAGFVHLHVHSAYSLLKGSIKIQKLAELAKADRQPALALTDTDNMFGALEFSDKMAGYGIQPIIGCELAVDFGDQDPNARNALAEPARIVLLAARERGYRSLMRLNSRAFLEKPVHQAPHVKVECVQGEAHDALLCIAGGRLVAETDREQLTPDHRFKTRAEMAVLFADVPEALASTIEIAERCSFRPVMRKPILPRFTVGAGANTADAASEEAAELRRQAEEGLSNRLKVHGLARGASEEDYRARLAFELDVITRMN